MTTGEINGLDMAFLCLEQRTAPMHVGGVAVFEPGEHVSPSGLAALLAERSGRMPRMRMRVRTSWLPPGNAHWEEDPGFRTEEHVHVHGLPWPGGPDELAGLVSELAAEPLDLTRPLWELHLITGLRGGRFAVLVKLHHALADGSRAVELGLNLLDHPAPATGAGEPAPSAGARTLAGTAHHALRALTRPDRLVQSTLAAAGELRKAAQRTGTALDIGWSVARNVQLPEPGSPLLAPPSRSKRIELVTLDLQDLRRIRKRHGGTTNDALLGIVTGALRLWLTTRGDPLEELSPRALIPVSRRSREVGRRANNQLSGYLCPLPVHEPDPARRMRSIRAAMRHNKATGPAHGPGALPVLADQLPAGLHRLLAPLAGRSAPLLFDTVITNVPIPPVPAALGGAGLRELYPLVPLACGHALSIAACQYRDRVHLGLQANRDALPDIEKLNEALPHALAELDHLAL